MDTPQSATADPKVLRTASFAALPGPAGLVTGAVLPKSQPIHDKEVFSSSQAGFGEHWVEGTWSSCISMHFQGFFYLQAVQTIGLGHKIIDSWSLELTVAEVAGFM